MRGNIRVGAVVLYVAVALGGCERAANHPAARPAADPPSAAATTPTTQAARPATRPATQAATRPAASGPSEKLYGTWVADDVDAKMGEVKIRLVFKEEGPVRIAAWSDIPFVGQVRDRTAPYEVHGNTISSDAIRGGTTVKYWFDGGQLVIEYKDGKTVHFRRP
jgi:hypothetical protein